MFQKGKDKIKKNKKKIRKNKKKVKKKIHFLKGGVSSKIRFLRF